MTTRTILWGAALTALLVFASAAHAEVRQPNGAVMPQDSRNGETQLFTLFAGRGEAIDFRADGTSEPALFSPLCDFRATFLLHEAGSSYAVGWYNADLADTSPPVGGEINVIVPAGAPVGTVITGADIRSSPAYAGGLIGFALVGGQTHYTEARYNPVCTGCAPAGPWIMAVIYRSVVTPSAYYVAFEDGAVGSGPGDFSNDGDYNDYVYLFEGLVCVGGGEPCDTGMPGICATGVTECSGGSIVCRPTVPGRTETCNGLDDDCNAATDDGDLCPAGEVCDRGVCVGRCMGEFGCPPGLECFGDGFCVEAACVDVTCPAGEVCRAGVCAGPCDGVVCPLLRVCRAGRCVDPCAGVTCEAGRTCEDGFCREHCACAPCEGGLACDAVTGACGDPACAGLSCDPGFVCMDARCPDACEGAVCPRGQRCEVGECVDDPTFGVDGGGPGPTGDGGGVPGDDAGGDEMDAGTTADGGRPVRHVTPDAGCACRAAASGHGGLASCIALAIAAAVFYRRRRTDGRR